MNKIDELIEGILKKEPDFVLESNFNDLVFKKIRTRERRSQQWFYSMIFLGIAGLLGAGYFLLSYFSGPELLKEFGQLVPLAITLGVIVALIQYLDKKLVKDKMINQLI